MLLKLCNSLYLLTLTSSSLYHSCNFITRLFLKKESCCWQEEKWRIVQSFRKKSDGQYFLWKVAVTPLSVATTLLSPPSVSINFSGKVYWLAQLRNSGRETVWPGPWELLCRQTLLWKVKYWMPEERAKSESSINSVFWPSFQSEQWLVLTLRVKSLWIHCVLENIVHDFILNSFVLSACTWVIKVDIHTTL